jgi:hypothetical protein
MNQKYLQELAEQRQEILTDIEYLRQLIVDNQLNEDNSKFYDTHVKLQFNDHVMSTAISYSLVAAAITSLEHDLYNCDVCMVGVAAADVMNPSHTDKF